MWTESILAYILKIFFFVTSPVTFLVGIFLLFDFNTYMRIEQFFSHNVSFPPKKKFIGELNKQREMLQMFLLKWRRIIGIICLFNSVAAILFTMAYLLKR